MAVRGSPPPAPWPLRSARRGRRSAEMAAARARMHRGPAAMVRAPSRLDRDAFVPGQPPFLLTGGPDVRSEVAKVLEVGYRGQPWRSASVSITAFHADYDHLRTQEIAPSRKSLFFGSGMEGTMRGFETWLTEQASRRWRL